MNLHYYFPCRASFISDKDHSPIHQGVMVSGARSRPPNDTSIFIHITPNILFSMFISRLSFLFPLHFLYSPCFCMQSILFTVDFILFHVVPFYFLFFIFFYNPTSTFFYHSLQVGCEHI